ncbi:MAG: sugar ABC transporter permease, partial [Chloroflexota bacterium]
MSTDIQLDQPAPSAGPAPGRKRGRTLSDKNIRNLFIWPMLILLIVVNVFPLIYSLFLSFTDYSAIASKAPVWVAFENFGRVLLDENMWGFFTTTGKFVLFSVGLELIIGFILAMFVKESFLGSGIITTLILVPMMLSPVVVGLFWKLMYNPTFGYVNYLIGMGGADRGLDILASRYGGSVVPDLALLGVIVVDVWMWTP